METKTFVRNKFAEYYRKTSDNIQPPLNIEKREFGFFLFRERMMLRHRGFRDTNSLRSFLKRVAPSDVHYSSAHYENPEADMEEKGWLGADLVFDIDADHIPTPCAKNHDTWVCNNCGVGGKGAAPEKCPQCGRQRFDRKTWLCEVCLASAKAEVMKLLDMLMKDFGYSSKEIMVAFSGQRGYHIHVDSEEIHGLDALSRREIVDYITGIGLDPTFHGLAEWGRKGSGLIMGPGLNDIGWAGRVARGTYDFLLTSSQIELERIGVKKIADVLIKYKESLVGRSGEKGPWGKIKGLNIEGWGKIVRQGIEKQSVKIDTVVTTDIHRLIRLSNTLHGQTGLKKTQVPITNIEEFDPLKSATAFKKGSVTVCVSEAPQFRLLDDLYGPYKDQEIELPTSAALLLLCKGLARVK